MASERPVIAITMGDPAGVGAEVIAGALADKALWAVGRPVVYGDLARMVEAVRMTGLPLSLTNIASAPPAPVAPVAPAPVAPITAAAQPAAFPAVRGEFPTIEVIDFANVPAGLPFGTATARGGRAALDYIERAVADCVAGRAAAVVTAPISKEAIRAAGSPFSGHTDMLAWLTGARRWAMTLVAGELRANFVTDHIALADVSKSVTLQRVLERIELAAEALSLLGEGGRAIAVAGLNPHAGEGGMFGREEMDVISPAIEAARGKGINCLGPVPGDTAFYRMARGDFAFVVAMYHDQGFAPIKTVAFDSGVNWTVGLPIVRTSPDHGTAFDIAGKGLARPDSLKAAYQLAARIIRRAH